MLQLVNELFQTKTNQTLFTGTDVFYHNLNFKKQGNIVHVDGFIINKYATTKTNINMVTILNSIYYVKPSNNITTFAFTDPSGTPVKILFQEQSIKLMGSMAADQVIVFNTTYQTND